MKPDMKNAFENYFSKLNSLYRSTFGTMPTVPYVETLEKSLLIGDPDEDGEIQWTPKEQTKILDWVNCETQLGFKLCQELKDYYNAFYFLAVSGTFGTCELHFYRIDGSEPVEEVVLRNYNDAQYIFPRSQMFLIGNAIVNDDDGYFIYYDNATGKLFCYESDTNNEVLLSYSIAKTIGSMEASL